MILVLLLFLPSALASCPAGSYAHETSIGNSLCLANACTCSGGTGATGSSCPTHNTAKCVSCGIGYWLNGTECDENQCTCSSGTGARGSSCPTHNTAKCWTCSGNTYLKDGKCLDWQTCSVGQYEFRAPDNDLDRSCLANACTCSGGTGARGTACPNNGDSKCVSCNTGYWLDGIECDAYTCTCDNGVAATGADCTSDGAKCVSCDADRYLSDGECKVSTFTCYCDNGTPKSPCTQDGIDCEDICDEGYHRIPNFKHCAIRCTNTALNSCLSGEGIEIVDLLESKLCGNQDLCEYCNVDQLKSWANWYGKCD
jgi:hypothetical protein